jgi:2,3-bisphosphoglycerate-independent phosphoglycerate mutase
MGNSEVGHLNLGAGSVVKQDLVRINEADFAENETLVAATRDAPRLHLVGLVSDGGVHSSLDHLERLAALARSEGVADVVVHAFTDGRDTSPHGGAEFVARVDAWEGVRVGTVVGRYYGMDRDKRAERTEKARALLVDGAADHHAETGEAAVRAAYERGETDEFIAATTVGEEARVRPGDSVVTFNFRPDRMRQIVTALAEGGAEDHDADRVRGGLAVRGRVPARAPRRDARDGARRPRRDAAPRRRDEKYPHVTYFFNGGEEEAVRPASAASSSRRRATCRPTTTSPR